MMSEAMNRQQVFVSSTVKDFADLRSAIKFWLEELGLIVYMSEFADFSRKVNDDTYRSCFGVIPRCDYFVLLIGARRGWWYVDGEVSVTQQEFRIAAELAKQGQINLIVLARDSVTRALKSLKDLGAPLGRDRIEVAGTEIEDPDFTDQFLQEVKDTQISEKGDDPSGQMWVYNFTDFRDVADILRSNLQLFGSVPRQTLLANLRWELVENISRISSKEDGLPRPGYWFMENIRQEVKLDSTPPLRGVHLTIEQASHLVWFVVTGMPGPGSLRTVALSDAIRSREFLAYNQQVKKLEPTELLKVMYELLAQIEGFEHAYKWWWDKNLDRIVNELRMGIDAGMPMVHELDLLFLFGFYDRLVNIMRLAISLIDHIDDPSRVVVGPELFDSSPYGAEESKRVREESATLEDVDKWLKFEVTRRNLTRQTRREIEISEWLETFDEFPTLWDLYARKHSVTREDAMSSLKLQEQLHRFWKIAEADGFEAAVQFLRDLIRADQGLDSDESASEANP